MSMTVALMAAGFLLGTAIASGAASHLQSRKTRYDQEPVRQGWRDLGVSVWILAGAAMMLPVLLIMFSGVLGPLRWLW